MKIILASASPRRRELLGKTGLEFEVIPAKGEEVITKTVPAEIVKELSGQKATEIAGMQTEECIVIGSDTIVAKGLKVMGKPKSEEEAFEMLTEISGTTHEVYTGVTIIKTGKEEQVISFAEKTSVEIFPMSDREKWDYIATKDPMDKAGAYGIQGDFAVFVKGIVGDYYNVVGLPVGRVYQELKTLL
ncbi:MAG: Maf family protein [Lachnospiraceae bacterium]